VKCVGARNDSIHYPRVSYKKRSFQHSFKHCKKARLAIFYNNPSFPKRKTSPLRQLFDEFAKISIIKYKILPSTEQYFWIIVFQLFQMTHLDLKTTDPVKQSESTVTAQVASLFKFHHVMF